SFSTFCFVFFSCVSCVSWFISFSPSNRRAVANRVSARRTARATTLVAHQTSPFQDSYEPRRERRPRRRRWPLVPWPESDPVALWHGWDRRLSADDSAPSHWARHSDRACCASNPRRNVRRARIAPRRDCPPTEHTPPT